MNVMQQPGLDLPYGTVPGPCSQMVRLFLVFIYIWREEFAKIFKVPGVSRSVNPARSKTWLVNVTIYSTTFQ